MQQRLKPKARPAWAWVVAAKFLKKLLVPIHYPVTALDLGFRGVAPAPFARYLKTSVGRGGSYFYPWHTSVSESPEDQGGRILMVYDCARLADLAAALFHF